MAIGDPARNTKATQRRGGGMGDEGMKCKTCGTEHRGIPKHGGYCLDHQVQRAEAAEALATEQETRAKSWHDSAMTLADQRDAAYKRNTELEAERDAFAAENDAVHNAINQMCGTDTSTIEAVQHVIQQRDDLHNAVTELREKLDAARLQLEQAQGAQRALDQALNEGDGTYRP